MDRFIELPVFGISVTLQENNEGNKSGTITSDLHDRENGLVLDTDYNVAMDALESFILACACSGVDIETASFAEAIEVAVQSISDNT